MEQVGLVGGSAVTGALSSEGPARPHLCLFTAVSASSCARFCIRDEALLNFALHCVIQASFFLYNISLSLAFVS